MKTVNSLYRIAVCDDEATDRELITHKTTEICRWEQINASIKCFGSTGELLKEIEQGEIFDLLLVDVMMPEQNGMEFAEEIRRQNRNTAIVFISSNRDMAMRGYLVAAERYLAKPVEEEHLAEAIRHCFRKYCGESGILLPCQKGTRRLIPAEVLYIETGDRKCRVVQKDEVWEADIKMEDLEVLLNQRGFIRCHRGFLVNYRYIQTLKSAELVMIGRKKIPISKLRSNEVRDWYFEQMSR